MAECGIHSSVDLYNRWSVFIVVDDSDAGSSKAGPRVGEFEENRDLSQHFAWSTSQSIMTL